MSANTRIFLPSDVRSLDVAKAVAILAGLPPSSTEYGLTVKGLELSSSTPGAAVEFILRGPMVDGAREHQFSLSYENSDYPGHDRGIYVLSTAFWVAIGRRLIKLFGGVLHYTDCGDTEPEESNLRLWAYPREADDAGRLALASRIYKLQPLTIEEMNSAADYSYYHGPEE